ncbi:MAG: hypothetical protein IJU79_03790 [Desulfovibrionaceae bacterium]|nr:hypothetical protein [Desulfovibrionaceae bacterium]
MSILFENKDFILSKSNTNFDKNVIYLPSAGGLTRIGINRTFKSALPRAPKIDGIYTRFGINEIVLECKHANWYQRDSFFKILKILKSLDPSKTVIYGSSMGGFGAIHIGLELGITSIAFSPQATLTKEFGVHYSWYEVGRYARLLNKKYLVIS